MDEKHWYFRYVVLPVDCLVIAVFILRALCALGKGS